MKTICSLMFIIFLNTSIAQTTDLQDAINSSTNGKVSLSGETITITAPVYIPDNFLIEGNGTTIINETNDFTFKIVGKEGKSTIIAQDITPGGGIPNINPTVTVEDATLFHAGDYVKVVKSNAMPVRIEFNIVKSVEGNVITMKKRFLQHFFKKDKVKIIQFIPKENVEIKVSV